MVPTSFYVFLAALLFTIGAVTVLVRRNTLIIYMGIELMLNAANLAFVAFARQFESLNGQLFVSCSSFSSSLWPLPRWP